MGRVFEIATTPAPRRYCLMTLPEARTYLAQAMHRASTLSRSDPATYGGLNLIEQGVFAGNRRLSLSEAGAASGPFTPYLIWEL